MPRDLELALAGWEDISTHRPVVAGLGGAMSLPIPWLIREEWLDRHGVEGLSRRLVSRLWKRMDVWTLEHAAKAAKDAETSES